MSVIHPGTSAQEREAATKSMDGGFEQDLILMRCVCGSRWDCIAWIGSVKRDAERGIKNNSSKNNKH